VTKAKFVLTLLKCRSAQEYVKYDWLEQPKATECLEWVYKENAMTAQYLDSLPGSAGIAERMRELVTTNSPVPEFILSENPLFRLIKSNDKKAGVGALETRNDETKDWGVIVDMDSIGKAEGRNWVLRNSRYLSSFFYGSRLFLGFLMPDPIEYHCGKSTSTPGSLN
jgi:prolyl oligopeptidase PreP (S9A serine peptidase family)